MKNLFTRDKSASFLDINALRIGHYVYLDLGWMGHPFALNSFRITSADQIATIKSLGLARIRYSPELSEPSASEARDGTGDRPGASAPSAHDGETVTDATTAEENQAQIRQARRDQIAGQRARLAHCEQQFGAAARAYKQIVASMHAQPGLSKNLCDTVIDNMIAQLGSEADDACVRLLSEKAGEKTVLHSINVSIISLLLGKALACDTDTIRAIGSGALLHDLGKMELPVRLRWSEDNLNAAERALYREHVPRGVTLVRAMGVSDLAQQVVAEHHEASDGSGYDHKLRGEQICLAARIVCLVNRYDDLCNPANPALALTPHEALSQLYAQHKAQFDNTVIARFIHIMGVYPPGSVVELSDGRHALVVSVNSGRPLRPRVLIHDPGIPAAEALIADLDNTPELGIRRSMKPGALPEPVRDYLSPRQRLSYFFERTHDDAEDTGT